MTQEEKAKAYDNVVNKLRRFMAQGVEPLITRADVQDFFPELAESEDERIRQKFIKLVKMSSEVGGFALHKWEADEMLTWFEKQGKSKWSEEDEQYLLICKNALHKYQWSDKWDADLISKWLEDKLKQRLEEQR